MLNKSQFRYKVIVASTVESEQLQLTHFLQSFGFEDVGLAKNSKEVFDHLKPFSQNPEQFGLLILYQTLLDERAFEGFKDLTCNQDQFAIPIILLKESGTNVDATSSLSDPLLYQLSKPVSNNELKILMDVLISFKDERILRLKQQEKLSSELAARKLLDAKLNYLVAHDELTGLINRHSLEQKIRSSLIKNNNFEYESALILIDLDRFSLINDLEGFDTADKIIIEVVSLIRKQCPGEVAFARIDSDEFCLFLDNISHRQDRKIAEKIQNAMNEHRFIVGETYYHITVSIGIAYLNSKQVIQHPAELISKAHQACSLAKQNGRNMVWIYNEKDELIKEKHKDVYWVPLIRDALILKRFFMVYQPVVNLDSGLISHYEGLIRMHGYDDQVVNPGEFIPVAERMGLIHKIDIWVVNHAIDFLSNLPKENENVSISINLSGFAFQNHTLLPEIKNKLLKTGVKANRITFEITETAAIDNFEQTSQMINKIRALGCQFALDDFGAGFCSFNYLKKFPVDFVKIDGQFIQNLMDDETDQVLVGSMNEIAHQLGKKTIAEFIDSPHVLKILKKMGIDYGQGYIFGKPNLELIRNNKVSLEALIDKLTITANSPIS